VQKCGITVPETAKLWHFVHEFATEEVIVCSILRISQHLCASISSLYVFSLISFTYLFKNFTSHIIWSLSVDR